MPVLTLILASDNQHPYLGSFILLVFGAVLIVGAAALVLHGGGLL